MAWVYRDFDFSGLGNVLLHEMNWWWMLLSLFFGIMSHVMRGWRWKLTLAPLGAYPKTNNSVNAIFIAYASNILIPRVGEVSRCGILSKYDDISFSKSLGTVVTERLIDAICAILITLIALFSQMKVFEEFFKDTGTDFNSYVSVFTSARFYILLFCTAGVLYLAYRLFKVLSFYERVKGVVLNVWEGVISLKNVKNLPLFIFYTLAIWVCYFLQFYVTFYCFSFTGNLGLLAGLSMFAGGSIAVIVPTPNGAGPWHLAVISMIMLYGVNNTDAGIFALVVHGIQTFLVILLGIYALIALPLTNKKRSGQTDAASGTAPAKAIDSQAADTPQF